VSLGACEFEHVESAAALVRRRLGDVPEVAVVLGSGLGGFAGALVDAAAMEYTEIPGWPPSRVVGHAGRLVVGRLGARRVAALAGRAHLYEGHSAAAVAFGVRVMGRLGVRRLILTNAAGGINTTFARGALMLIDDHINLTGANPLTGPNDERFGARFPDMSEVYSGRLRRVAEAAAADAGIAIARGVYAAVHGPSYETPAEIRFLRAIGADAVGMSTVAEAIAARHMGIEVLGISCITNMAAGVLPAPIDHEEVLETARQVGAAFIRLLEGVIGRM
jgi:purine-nucleoside phosphorylase